MGDIGGESAGLPAKAVMMASVDLLALVWKDLSDMGNATRFVMHARGRIIHVREWGWLAYDGVRWSPEDGERLAVLNAHEVARGIRDEAKALGQLTDEEAKGRWGDWAGKEELRKSRATDLLKWALTSGNASKTKAMMEQAAALDVLNRPMALFDEDPLVINAENRTLKLVRRDRPGADGKHWQVEDSDHDPADHLTRVTGCKFDRKADCPEWKKHLEQCLPNVEVRRFFQAVMGYAMTGRTDEQIILMLQGRGGDGKSTTMNVIRLVLGGYAMAGAVETFLDTGLRSGSESSPDLMKFAGDMRLICIGEPKRGARLAEERVKQFTGDSPVQARPNYGDFIEFEPRGQVVLECNAKPRISGDDDGIWRRIIVIAFPVQFKGSAAEKGRKRRLLEEAPGILNWLLEGARDWLENGLVVPESVREIVEEYRRSANPFGEWLAARVDTSDPEAKTVASELYNDYKAWCAEESVGDRELLTSTAFGRSLGDRHINLAGKNSKGLKLRRGAKLRPGGPDLAAMADRASPSPAKGGGAARSDWPSDDDEPA